MTCGGNGPTYPLCSSSSGHIGGFLGDGGCLRNECSAERNVPCSQAHKKACHKHLPHWSRNVLCEPIVNISTQRDEQ